MRQIDLPPGDYVEVPNRPLDKPSRLLVAMAFWGGMSIVGAVAAWMLGGLWAAFLPIPFAFWLGVAATGRFPAFFYRRDR